MYKQTEPKYKRIKLGYGKGSIYDYGCYLVSLVNGMNLHGWGLTPEGLNEDLKNRGLWFGEFGNYININKLHVILPEMFSGFRRLEPYNDHPPLGEILRKGRVVLAKVDARGIGGSGTHFVLVRRIEGGVAIIHDPFTGKEEPVTKQWRHYGNILGLRIFDVKEKPVLLPNEEMEKCWDRVGYLERTLEDKERDLKNETYAKQQLEQALEKLRGEHEGVVESNRQWHKFLDELYGMLAPISDISEKNTQNILGEVRELINKEDRLEELQRKVGEIQDHCLAFVTEVGRILQLPIDDENALLRRLQEVVSSNEEEESAPLPPDPVFDEPEEPKKSFIQQVFAIIIDILWTRSKK